MKSRVLGLGCAVLVFAACSDPDSGSEEPVDVAAEVRSRIDAAVADGFSGAILVTNDGERLATEAHGLADRDAGVANTIGTAFDVGSILKTFTATAIFRLVEDGELALDTTLSEIFPDVPADKASITLVELVQHSAGFDEYHDTTGDFEAMTRLEAREHIFAQELLFEPGTDEAYSNSGYTLLADVVETVSGEPYVDFVRGALFDAAAMGSSGFYSEPVWQTVDTARGYDASTFGENDPATWPYTWALVGNGGLVTTVGDLDRWITALFGGAVVGAETLELMREEYFGSGEVTVGGELVYGEAGAGDYGLGGVAIFAPESDTRVIVATNTYETFDIEEFAADLALFLLEAE
ncbi:MAG TPA: serine hydrolase domain-containing protein [Polyangiaceae bacterium]